MELRQLEQFVAVAEEGHFARAAARCTVVPSALSTSVRVLERELGVPLLRRTTRSVSLTEAGRAFLAEARNCLAAAASARAVVGHVQQLLSGSLNVGGVPTFGLLDQPGLLRRLRADHPAVTIRYTRDTSGRLLDGVRAGRLDVAVVSLPDPAPTDLTVRPIATGPVLLACSADHRLAGRTVVSCDDLAGECFVATRAGSRGHEYLNRIFASAGVPPNVPYEVDDVPTMLDFVEAGLGVALVIEPIAAGRPALRSIPLAGSAFSWTVGVVTPPADQTTPAARYLLGLIDPPGTRPGSAAGDSPAAPVPAAGAR